MNSELINKKLYKIFLIIIKFTPISLAIINILGTILNYFGIPSILLSIFGGASIIFLIILYLISFVFCYCYLFRIPLYYLTIVGCLKFIDFLFIIPFNTLVLFQLHLIILGIFIVLFIWYAYKNRNSEKVDPIIDLCRRYCNINCECNKEV